MAAKTVDGYVGGLERWQAEIVARVRQIVQKTAPEASESMKWSQPVFEINGPFAYLKAFKKAVNFGFWRGADLTDPDGLLRGTGDKMRHLRLKSTEDIDEAALSLMVQQAVILNLQKGDPTIRS